MPIYFALAINNNNLAVFLDGQDVIYNEFSNFSAFRIYDLGVLC